MLSCPLWRHCNGLVWFNSLIPLRGSQHSLHKGPVIQEMFPCHDFIMDLPQMSLFATCQNNISSYFSFKTSDFQWLHAAKQCTALSNKSALSSSSALISPSILCAQLTLHYEIFKEGFVSFTELTAVKTRHHRQSCSMVYLLQEPYILPTISPSYNGVPL